jgi:hypothetical protein
MNIHFIKSILNATRKINAKHMKSLDEEKILT